MKMLMLILLSLFTVTVSAEEEVSVSLQINGVSWHSRSKPNGEDYNAANSGLGVQFSKFALGNKDIVLSATVGTMINSMEDRSWYAGGIVARRWSGESWHLDTGIFLGVLTYPSYEQGWLIIPAPILSFGTKHLGVNITGILPVDNIPAAVFIQPYITF